MTVLKLTAIPLSAPAFWERRGILSWLLWPLSKVYGTIVSAKKALHDLGFGKGKPFPVPVIIVGNVRVGGTGKTPIVIALAERLRALGYRPGIISRGYGAGRHRDRSNPIAVNSASDPSAVGDEPVLMAQRTHDQVPIWVCPSRRKSIRALLKAEPNVNVIISDDGLQHLDLIRWPAREGGRDIEIIARDNRGEGNGFLLPAGPLREPVDRDRDITLTTGASRGLLTESRYIVDRPAFTLEPKIGIAYPLHHSDERVSLDSLLARFANARVTAVAGIGNPHRFFDSIKPHLPNLETRLTGIALPDHATFDAAFFNAIDAQCILITEKDAVKCIAIQDERVWVVPMLLTLPQAAMDLIESILKRPDPN